jgi:hypothetical protein
MVKIPGTRKTDSIYLQAFYVNDGKWIPLQNLLYNQRKDKRKSHTFTKSVILHTKSTNPCLYQYRSFSA